MVDVNYLQNEKDTKKKRKTSVPQEKVCCSEKRSGTLLE